VVIDRTLPINELTERIIGACLEVHRELGPGLLESAYEECVCHELSRHGIAFERQRPLPVRYKDVFLELGYRLDIVIEQQVIVELKTVDRIMPVHEAQLMTYLKLTGIPVGLLVNFHVPLLKDGIKRLVNNLPVNSASPRLRG
jgi:GxxExxY protein